MRNRTLKITDSYIRKPQQYKIVHDVKHIQLSNITDNIVLQYLHQTTSYSSQLQWPPHMFQLIFE